MLDDLSDDELNAPGVPEGERSPVAGAPSAGYAFLFIPQHEMVHIGQLSVCRRGLGNELLFQP